MGLTPLSGLPGATRAGDIDPSLVFHYGDAAPADDADVKLSEASDALHLSRAEHLLNTAAGWKALAGTADFGEIVKRAKEGNEEQAKLAFDVFVDRVIGAVGGAHVRLRGKVDALVFAEERGGT